MSDIEHTVTLLHVPSFYVPAYDGPFASALISRFASSWPKLLQDEKHSSFICSSDSSHRALNHATTLLDLIDRFPQSNPTPHSQLNSNPPGETLEVSTEQDLPDLPSNGDALSKSGSKTDVDLAALLSTMRAKYRLFCSSISLRPRLVPGSTTRPRASDNDEIDGDNGSKGGSDVMGQMEGIEGPLKGVDTSKLRF